MKTEMRTEDYHSVITARISAEKAFQNINHVWEWWTTDFEGSSQNLNDLFTVRFGETFVTFKVVESIPSKKIAWLVTDCYLHWLKDKKEWKNTQLDWKISSKGDATRIDFTHVGLVPEIECYNDCKKGWNFYSKESLKSLLTEGKGMPETPKSVR